MVQWYARLGLQILLPGGGERLPSLCFFLLRHVRIGRLVFQGGHCGRAEREHG